MHRANSSNHLSSCHSYQVPIFQLCIFFLFFMLQSSLLIWKTIGYRESITSPYKFEHPWHISLGFLPWSLNGVVLFFFFFFFIFFFLIKENLLDWQKWIACTSNTCFCTMLWYQCLELFFIWNRLHNVCLPKWIEAGRAFVLYNNKND